MTSSLRLLSAELPVAGLTRRRRILLVSGAHLCECDHRDADQQERLGKLNRKLGGGSLANFDRLIYDLPHIAPDFVAFGGDMIESATAANWEIFATRLATLRVPFGLTLGERDWDSPSEWAYERRQSYRERQWLRYIAEHRWSPEFDEAILDGARLVFLDNSDYQIRVDQFRQFNRVLRTGDPMILFCHIPLSLPYLRRAVVEKCQDPILCGETDWDPRRRGRLGVLPRNTVITRRFHAVALEAPSLVAAFAGHVDLDRKDRMPSGALQYVTPPLCRGFARLITLVPSGHRGQAACAAPLREAPAVPAEEAPALVPALA